VLQRHDVDVAPRRRVDRRDDAADAPHVLGVVGDHDGVVGGVGVDRVVGSNQGAKHLRDGDNDRNRLQALMLAPRAIVDRRRPIKGKSGQ